MVFEINIVVELIEIVLIYFPAASAMAKYIKYESDKTREHSAVFVAVSDFNKLKDAYPNYFIDLNKFSSMIKFMLENSKNEVKI